MRNEFESFATREMGVNKQGLSRYARNFDCKGLGTSIIKESDSEDFETMNVFTRLMADRIIFFGDEVTHDVANIVMAQLLYLNATNSEEPIKMYINTPGGSVTAGLGIYDMMNHIEAPVYTTCTAVAASMGATLLSSGEKGHRTATKHSRIMIHELWGGYEGKFHDIRSNAKFTETLHEDLCEILAKNTGKSIEEINEICKSDYWMRASEALDFGLIDKILD